MSVPDVPGKPGNAKPGDDPVPAVPSTGLDADSQSQLTLDDLPDTWVKGPGSPGKGNHWVTNPPGVTSPTGHPITVAYDGDNKPTGLALVWDPARKAWARVSLPAAQPPGWTLPTDRPGAYDLLTDDDSPTPQLPPDPVFTGSAGYQPNASPSSDDPGWRRYRNYVAITAIAAGLTLGALRLGHIFPFSTSSSAGQPSSVQPGGSSAGSPAVAISSDPVQAVNNALILSVPGALSVHHDTRIVTAVDTQITHYLETYSTSPLAVYTTGALPDGSAISATTIASGTTCSTSFGHTNVFTGQALTKFNNYAAFGRAYAITAPKFESDGPIVLAATTTPTYKKIIGNGPAFTNQPSGRSYQANTIEVFIDAGTGLIAEVVEHAKFTDANGAVTDQTVTYHDYNHHPAVNIPKCP